MPIMQSANPRQIKVFNDKGSLNQAHDIPVNTIAPMANPSNLEGHSCPSKCDTKCLTEDKYRRDKGIPIRDMIKGLSFAH